MVGFQWSRVRAACRRSCRAIRLWPSAAGPTILVVFSLLIQAMAAGGIVWSGLLLARGRRLGGYVALGFVLLPIVFAALIREPLDIFEIAFAVLGVIVLAVIWHELK